MKSFKKFTLILFVVIVLISVTSMQVSATNLTQDGLEVNLTTNKGEYGKNEQIVATLNVKNNNETVIANISLENIIPDGYKLAEKSEATKQINSLEPKDSIELITTYVSTSTIKENPDVPNIPSENNIGVSNNRVTDEGKIDTGDTNNIGVFCVLLLVSITVIVLCVKNNKCKQLLSLFLCALIIFSIIPSSSILVSAETSQSTINISQNIIVDNRSMSINSCVIYDSPINTIENITIDLSNMLYDKSINTYYVAEYINTLAGTLAKTDNIAKAKCEVTDINGKLLLEKEFEATNSWTVNDFAMIVGINNVKITVEYNDGITNEKTVIINNLCEENMNSLNVDKNDDDNDGVLNFTEEMYHTDSLKEDSDGDELTDYYELAVLGTDPNKKDTDNNGISDADEDFDGDGISNGNEINKYKTESINIDTDGDNLSDFDEINTHKTDPCKVDTDDDGKDDYWEIENGYEPLVTNDSFPEDEENILSEGITVVSDGYIKVTEVTDDHLLNENTPGYIGKNPIYVDMNEGNTADITINYDPTTLKEGDTPKLYYFNEKTQCYEEVPSELLEGGSVKATVSNKGVYMLLNHRFVDDVWQNDIFRPSDNVEGGSVDVVFVIDRSYSMYDNDPMNIRKTVTKEFINKLRDNTDKAAIVQFSAVAETIMTLTSNKEALCTAVDGIENSDGGGCSGTDANAGTNGSAGIRNALTELNGSTAAHKYIIFLTDGKDTTVSEDYGDEYAQSGLTKEAHDKGIIIHTVGLVGTGEVDTDLLKRVAKGTGGNYYLATVGEDAENNSELVKIYEDIETITIDRHIDSNNDGISDYYTKMICEGRLTTATGKNYLFGTATYDQIQLNADYDGDGLLNGEEIEILENENGVYVKINSYPTTINSDSDGLGDYEEIKYYTTSPFKDNSYAYEMDVNWAINSENFVSEKYRSLYDSKILGSLERGSVLIGNVFFGTTYDQSLLYQSALVDYFNTINQELQKTAELQNASNVSLDLTNQIFYAIDEEINSLDEFLEDNTDESYDIKAENIYKLIGNILNTIPSEVVEQFYDKYYKPLEGHYTVENLRKLSNQVQQLEASWLNIDSRIFSSSEDYWNYANNLFKEYNNAALKKTNFELEFSNFKKLEKASDIFNKLDGSFYLADVIQTGFKSYKEFTDLCSNIDIMQSNIYILDAIIAQSDDTYLTIAARNLKCKINTMHEEDINSFITFLGDYDYNAPIFSKACGELIHALVGDCGVPGMVIELVREFGNLTLNISDVSEACTKLYAVSKTADILALTYSNYLNAGNGTLANSKWVFYTDTSDKPITYFLNLVVARYVSEIKMIDADKANSFLMEWLFADIIYKVSNCESNKEKCKQIVGVYSR